MLTVNFILWPLSFNNGPKWLLNLDKDRSIAVKNAAELRTENMNKEAKTDL